ncbi:uncharacterized protein LOC130975833 [Arachis stenosperma]|uniref:uncharacterized protein LOC130975833 n=1 Tax=Arachis stenosperma TaxID=217475 RepID=UPI0025AD585C|nr:uncharacterized protein LOC130975833 [Arachis stenosperma]
MANTPSSDPDLEFSPAELQSLARVLSILSNIKVVRLALKSKNKLRFIDGTIQKSNKDDPTFIAWDKCNIYVVAWINLSLSTEIAQSVVWNEIAVDQWVDLKHRYYHGDLFKIAKLEEELHTMKQGDLTITGYYTKMKAVWKEIEGF